ncbi:hypothetical protein DES53_107305 [Roseimicrobium gellanilyticum]|uniref:Uncharacterized protein n=1 Tax=Roseimicrobium gellanilyticum TaxID=748857 RepID=A0A366HFX8_9BACT|nr:hypothetical protein [Roseimicrobium gellanilyticum]RBP41473.1 hypothetical protein DES53_107305 [Roseimicrobium gellanilyticum]
MNGSAKRAPSKLSKEDWDFSECPGDEKQYCLEYELARESKKAIEQVKHGRESEWALTCSDPCAADYYWQKRWSAFYSTLSQFPQIPWLKVPAKIRTKAMKAVAPLEGPLLTIAPPRLFDEDGEYREFPQDTGFQELTSVHAIEVDWAASDEALKASFEKWLERHRPSFFPVKETRGRTDAFELLKLLGAFRLLRHYGNWEDALNAVGDEHCGEHAPRYASESSWNRARRQAEQLITHGFVPGPGRSVVQIIDNAERSAIEKAKAKAFLAMQSRMEQRRLAKLKAEHVLDEITRRFTGSA